MNKKKIICLMNNIKMKKLIIAEVQKLNKTDEQDVYKYIKNLNKLNEMMKSFENLCYEEKKSKRCIAYTKNNTQCKNKTFNINILCKTHNKN